MVRDNYFKLISSKHYLFLFLIIIFLVTIIPLVISLEEEKIDLVSKGEYYEINNNKIYVPEGGRIFKDLKSSSNVIVSLPKGSILKELPQIIDSEKQENVGVLIEGENIIIEDEKLKGSVIEKGSLLIKNNKMYVSSDDDHDSLVLDGVSIKNTGKLDVELDIGEGYFRVITENSGEKKIGDLAYSPYRTVASGAIINFDKNNNFLQRDEGDRTLVLLTQGSSLNIEKNNDKSVLKIKGDGKIINDHITLLKKGNKISEELTSLVDGFFSSIPFEIYFESLDGSQDSEFYEGDKNLRGHKIIFDNFNRYAVVDESLDVSKVLYEGIDFEISARITHNYPNEQDIIDMIGGKLVLDSDIPKGKKDLVLGRLRDYWQTLDDETKDLIENIEIENYLLVGGAGANANYELKFMVEGNNFDYSAFRHEIAHLKTYKILEENIKSNPEAQRKLDRLQKSYREHEKARDDYIANLDKGDAWEPYRSRMIQLSQEQGRLMNWLNENVNHNLKKDWVGIKNFEYKENDQASTFWQPKDGFLTSYAKTEFDEHISETVAGITSKPEKFADLINKGDSMSKVYLNEARVLYKHRQISDFDREKLLRFIKDENLKLEVLEWKRE